MSSIWDVSTTAGSNTNFAGINIAPGGPASSVGPTLREFLAETKGALIAIAGAGTADAITASLTPAPAALVDGMRVYVRATAPNATTTPTFQLNALGSVGTIKKLGGLALVPGDIVGAGHLIGLEYVSSDNHWELLNPRHTLVDGANGGVSIASGAVSLNVNDLVTKASPVGADFVALYDSAGAATKKALLSSLFAGASQPTRTVLTSGSGTYNPPAGCVRINVRMVAGGGGGAGNTQGGAGGNTTFGASLTCTGGGSRSGSPGTATGGDVNITGGRAATFSGSPGLNAGPGGGTPFGSGGGGGTSGAGIGQNAAANSGAGGGGGGGGSQVNEGGGHGGGYLEKLIVSPAASYAYSVGTGGTGGSSGGALQGAGGNGGSGLIIIDEYYY